MDEIIFPHEYLVVKSTPQSLPGRWKFFYMCLNLLLILCIPSLFCRASQAQQFNTARSYSHLLIRWEKMAPGTGYGVFSILPYEVREMIWQEFLPVPQNSWRFLANGKWPRGADLRVLRASRDLYNEIHEVLYSKACLHFDLSPSTLMSPAYCCNASFKRYPYNKAKDNATITDAEQIVAWGLDTKSSRRLINFPFHKIAAVEVSLSPPDPGAPLQLYWLWRSVLDVIKILEDAGMTKQPLTIQIQKDDKFDWNEVGNICGRNTKFAYNSLIAPFFISVRNLQPIIVEPRPECFGSEINWKFINFARREMSKRAKAAVLSNPNVQAVENWLWDRLLDDFIWMQKIHAWKTYSDHTTYKVYLEKCPILDLVFLYDARNWKARVVQSISKLPSIPMRY